MELAHAGGIDEKPLLEGLPSVVQADGTAPRWIDWSDFAQLWERLETGLGGPDGFHRAARLAMPIALPELRALAAVFVTPLALFSFMLLRHMQTSFSNVQVEELERFDDGRIRWRETISPPHRPCPAFHRATRAFSALIPRQLGLSEANVKITSMTSGSAIFVALFPPPPPIAVRGRHALAATTAFIAAQLEDTFAIIGERIRARPPVRDEEGLLHGSGWAQKLALSPRQRDVFAHLVEGRANKEIAGALGCSERNVEFHVGKILRAARVNSRAELLVKVLGNGS